MLILLIVLISVLSFLIIAAVLLQDDKSGGGMGIIGGSSQSFFGASSGSFLQKFTAIAFTLFVLLILGTAVYISKTEGSAIITNQDIENTEIADYRTIVDFSSDASNDILLR